MIAVSAIQPFSRDSVRLAGPAADLPPIVDPNYVDAAVMPSLPSTNTPATVYTIAETGRSAD
ncbi:hypothetical protein A5724_08180 [Mycobacterium sp. ACS1612]|nr:hypothetical protein A5724_08180 [Mycobacterium sp. ACS1612]